VDGVIVVDKPQEWTSHDVVGKMRGIARTRRIGHLGTLDPIATGVLPLVIGKATRLSQFYTRSDKVYEAVVRFGFSTTTYDRAGEPTSPVTEPAIDREDLERRLAAYQGERMQTPPPVSAKKVDGVRAYKLARQSVAVDLAPVPVEVYRIELLALDGFRITPSTLAERLNERSPGDRARVALFRRDELLEVEVTLGKRPANACFLEKLQNPSLSQKGLYEAWLREPFGPDLPASKG
jgi:tRNA pseudouridine(55) synthase